MSKESRLAYHALPKVLPPLEGCISDVLSQAALEHAIDLCVRDSISSNCMVCGKTRGAIHSRSIPQDTRFPEPSLDIVNLHNPADPSFYSKPCSGCQWLTKTWPQFESYLSCSRINVNVRQVGNLFDE